MHKDLRAIFVLILALFFLNSCGTPYEPEDSSPEKDIPDAQISDNDPVEADATLETVTWNLEWFGDETYGSQSYGPADELQQATNIARVTDSLKADLYAFQEVFSQKALDDITENMPGYRGFVANHIDWKQKTAFVYNTNAIDSISTGPITDGQNAHAWAGRFPFYFKFNYQFEGGSREFYAVVIHAKAHTGENAQEYEDAYQRRKEAAEDLYTYLKNNKAEENIILLGDYNDDVDESIFYYSEGTYAQTPYHPFASDSVNFSILTQPLSERGNGGSTVKYSDMVDHITISDELLPFYKNQSAAVVRADQFISSYGSTTSDHYPVWAKFYITR